MTKLKCWGAPRELGEATQLRRMDESFSGKKSIIKEAESLTVRIRGVMIREKEETILKGDNDLIIATTFQFGSSPPAQRLHFMKNNVPLGWQGAFFNDVIISERDFGGSTLTLRVQVYDMDGIPKELIEGIRKAPASIAVTFPLLAPYAGAVSFIVPEFLKLVDNLDNHDRILDQRLKLEFGKPGMGRNLLQPGYYVIFRDAVEKGFYLSRDLRVNKNKQGVEFTNFSYAVLEVSREFRDTPEWRTDQKVATLIAELNGKGQSGKAAIDFLRLTIDGYSKFKKLNRVRELQNKKEPTEAEKNLLEEMSADAELAPFLKPTD